MFIIIVMKQKLIVKEKILFRITARLAVPDFSYNSNEDEDNEQFESRVNDMSWTEVSRFDDHNNNNDNEIEVGEYS